VGGEGEVEEGGLGSSTLGLGDLVSFCFCFSLLRLTGWMLLFFGDWVLLSAAEDRLC
jgi:hypothetical protein